MRKVITLILVVLAAASFTVSYAASGKHDEPTAAPSLDAELAVSDANGDVLKCNGKVAKVKVNGPPPFAPGQADRTMMDKEPKAKKFACKKDNGRETGEVEEVPAG